MDCGVFYLVDVGVSANGSNLAAVIQQEEIPFCGSVKLPDLNVSKPAGELLPNLRPHPVSKRQPHSVASIVELLRRAAKVAHDFADVLDDGDVVFPAVVPELRG